MLSFPKKEQPGKELVKILGLEVDLKSGRVWPEHMGIQDIIEDTLHAIRSERISRRAAALLVGRWMNALLVWRPLMSVLSVVYERRAFRGDQESVRKEFQCHWAQCAMDWSQRYFATCSDRSPRW